MLSQGACEEMLKQIWRVDRNACEKLRVEVSFQNTIGLRIDCKKWDRRLLVRDDIVQRVHKSRVDDIKWFQLFNYPVAVIDLDK